MPLGSRHVGQRVIVRYRLAQPEPTASATDVLGLLESFDGNELLVVTEAGDRVRVPTAAVLTAKPVPPRASTLARVSSERIQVITAQGWPPRTVEHLGDWWLREAAGFTGRANSVLPVGDPGVPLRDALVAVEAFYARHELPALAQVVLGTPLDHALHEAGWEVARHPEGVLVQVASVAQARRHARREVSAAVQLLDQPSPGWLGLYGRARDVPAEVVSAVVGGSVAMTVALASIGDPVVGIGRGVVTGDWLGMSAVEVTPAHRRQGLARRVVDELLAWGAEQGARSAYLQTLPGNLAAQALYAPYGFVTHHRYRYLAPARGARDRPAPDRDPAR